MEKKNEEEKYQKISVIYFYFCLENNNEMKEKV